MSSQQATDAKALDQVVGDRRKEDLDRIVRISRTGKLTPSDLKAFRCATEEEWRERVFRLLKAVDADPSKLSPSNVNEVGAVLAALGGVLLPTQEPGTLGERRQRFMDETGVSLRTVVRWERAGADWLLDALIRQRVQDAYDSRPTEAEIQDLDASIEAAKGDVRANAVLANLDYYFELPALVDALRVEIAELKAKVAKRDKIIADMRTVLDAADELD